MHARLAPAQPPFTPSIQASLDKIMPPGLPPLTLFTTLARDERLFQKLFSGGLLDKGHLSIRERELVISRVTSQCGSEYEWGVHMTLFATRIKLDEEQIYSLVHGTSNDTCWEKNEKLIIDMCDSLHGNCTLQQELWDKLRHFYSEEALLELIMLAGYYRTVSYLTNALNIPLEQFGQRFPTKKATSDG